MSIRDYPKYIFKAGDVVRCMDDNDNPALWVQKGRIYTVAKVINDFYVSLVEVLEKHNGGVYSMNRFVLANPTAEDNKLSPTSAFSFFSKSGEE